MIYRWYTTLNPEPWTAPTASVSRRGGRFIPMLHKNAKVRAYQEAVKEEFEAAAGINREPVEGPINLRFAFWRNTQHGRRCDLSNLNKALEDALQGHLFVNDSQVVELESWLIEQSKTTESRIAVELRTVTTQEARAAFTMGDFYEWVRDQDATSMAFEWWDTSDTSNRGNGKAASYP